MKLEEIEALGLSAGGSVIVYSTGGYVNSGEYMDVEYIEEYTEDGPDEWCVNIDDAGKRVIEIPVREVLSIERL